MIVALCVEMEQGNQQAVSVSTSSSKNSTTSGGGGKVTVTKCKRSVLTLERKLETISEVKKGKSVRLVPGQFGVPKSTMNDIWKGREKIESYVSASECPSLAKR